jgi:hypothetical protein
MKPWQVWSLDPMSGRWMVVTEGTEAEARAGAGILQSSAERRGIEGAEYRALPPGRTPEDDKDGPSEAELREAGDRFLRRFRGGQ